MATLHASRVEPKSSLCPPCRSAAALLRDVCFVENHNIIDVKYDWPTQPQQTADQKRRLDETKPPLFSSRPRTGVTSAGRPALPKTPPFRLMLVCSRPSVSFVLLISTFWVVPTHHGQHIIFVILKNSAKRRNCSPPSEKNGQTQPSLNNL